MKTIYSTLFEKGQHSFSLQSLMRTMLLCFFIAAATNGQAHEVDNIDYELNTDGGASQTYDTPSYLLWYPA